MNSLGINLVDIGVLLVLLFFLREGYRKGFFAIGLESGGFFIGVVVALLFYSPVGLAFASLLSVSRSFGKVIAFLLLWLIIEALAPIVNAQIYLRVPALWLQSKWNYRAGIFPAVLEALLICTFILSLAVSFTLPHGIKQHIFASTIGDSMVRSLQSVEAFASSIFGEGERETLSFMTIGRQENVTFQLGFKNVKSIPDPTAEQQMLQLVNAERVNNGLKPLVMDQSLTEVARLHGTDMLLRGYFSHNTPEGTTPADRADEAGIDYEKIGENLAYAPDVLLAHQGLLRSERHRRNILSTQFSKVGIGILNAGNHGLMFVQNFSD